jgi:hypothetical protein
VVFCDWIRLGRVTCQRCYALMMFVKFSLATAPGPSLYASLGGKCTPGRFVSVGLQLKRLSSVLHNLEVEYDCQFCFLRRFLSVPIFILPMSLQKIDDVRQKRGYPNLR